MLFVYLLHSLCVRNSDTQISKPRISLFFRYLGELKIALTDLFIESTYTIEY